MERLRDYVHIAGANLQATPLRSLLSVLGIVVGTASVISVLALGAGARKDLLDSVTKLGTEVFRARAEFDARTADGGKIDVEHLRAIRAAPFVVSAFGDIREMAAVRSRFQNTRGIIVPIDGDYMRLNGLRLETGREINAIDDEERRLVCVLNAATAWRLFPQGIPAEGAELFMLQNRWDVIGTFRRVDGPAGVDPEGTLELLVPFSSYLRNGQQTSIREITVHVKLGQEKIAKDSLMEILTRGDATKKGLYSVTADRERIAQRLESRRLLFVLWTAIAFISLFVGGMGMMNVMLTSVAERTREIGLRRALGARRKDILIQFLVEACILNVIGGILGLFVGAAVARALPLLLVDFGIRLAVMEPSFALGTVAVSMVMGIVFGLYPAIRAAAFSPAEALRSDG